MNSFITHEGSKSYLIIALESEILGELSGLELFASYEIKMLENNQISNILKPEYRALDGAEQMCIRADHTETLEELYTREALDEDSICCLYVSLIKTINEMSAYMLEPDNLVLDEKYILYDYTDKSFRFIYVPNYKNDYRGQIKGLTESIMVHINHRNHKLVDMVYGIYDVVASADYIMGDIGILLEYFKNEKNIPQDNTNDINSHHMKSIAAEHERLLDEVFIDDPSSSYKPIKEGGDHVPALPLLISMIALAVVTAGIVIYRYFFVTGQISYRILMAGMVCMCASLFIHMQLGKARAVKDGDADLKLNTSPDESSFQMSYGYREKPRMILVSKDHENEKYDVGGESVIIGRDSSRANVLIEDSAVSRCHAIISTISYPDEDRLVIEDLNSKNGTLLNGVRLKVGRKQELKTGDHLLFGQSEYVIKAQL